MVGPSTSEYWQKGGFYLQQPVPFFLNLSSLVSMSLIESKRASASLCKSRWVSANLSESQQVSASLIEFRETQRVSEISILFTDLWIPWLNLIKLTRTDKVEIKNETSYCHILSGISSYACCSTQLVWVFFSQTFSNTLSMKVLDCC